MVILAHHYPDFCRITFYPIVVLLEVRSSPPLVHFFQLIQLPRQLGNLKRLRVKQHKVTKVTRRFGVEWDFYTDCAHAPNGRIWIGWRRATVAVTILSSSAS